MFHSNTDTETNIVFNYGILLYLPEAELRSEKSPPRFSLVKLVEVNENEIQQFRHIKTVSTVFSNQNT